ncbi:MAG: hypothetical protein ACYC26_01910 [Phycisphaerales bacterium]
MTKAQLPIFWLTGTLVYVISLPFVAPSCFAKSRPGGPLISVFGELMPFILSVTGVILGVLFWKYQTALLKIISMVLILLGTAMIGFLFLEIYGTYLFLYPRLNYFGW